MSSTRTRYVQLAFVYGTIVPAATILLWGGVMPATAAPSAPTALSASSLQGAFAKEKLHGPILASTDATTNTIMLPLVQRRWPPIPYQPTLSAIINPDADGSYTVSWTEAPSQLADTYILQEATDDAFGDDQVVCTTAQQSCTLSGRLAGTYYYRVQGQNVWGFSPYSNVEMVTVLLPATPTLNYIDNGDGDANYVVSWTAATRATSYTLQEDTISNFEHPTSVYQGASLSWPASNKAPETYYYRVLATGPTGQSGWSNIQSVVVPVPSPVVRVLPNYYAYEDVFDDLHIVGEVQNDTAGYVDLVKVAVVVFNSHGQLIATDYTYISLSSLPPGEKTCFHIWLDSVDWFYYEFETPTYWSDADPLPNLTILNDNGIYDPTYSDYDILGQIRNDHPTRVNYVKAVGTLHNGQGKTVGCGWAYVNATNLDPGQTSAFDIHYDSYNRDYADVTSYRIQAGGTSQGEAVH